MFGVSYGELFLLLGATAALIGPKDLPLIARTAGRLAGRAIGYVQLARGQFDSVMQQTQARQEVVRVFVDHHPLVFLKIVESSKGEIKVHKELQDTIAQLEAIRYEIRSISMVNPAPMTRRLTDTPNPNPETDGDAVLRKLDLPSTASEVNTSGLTNVHRQATDFAKLAEASVLQASITCSAENGVNSENFSDQLGVLQVLPVSAENTGMLPKYSGNILGSDILLDAILEAEVAHKAKEFFLQPDNQIPVEKEGL